MSLITPVILVGGSGKRLWPLSRESMPKQFVPLLGKQSTFQQTLLRVADRSLFGRPVIATNDAYRFMAEQQAKEVDIEIDIVVEPERRDSGPAMAAAAAFARTLGAKAKKTGSTVFLDAEAFAKAPAKSIDYAVMERTDKCWVVPARFRWSDLGTWDALLDVGDADSAGNVTEGPVEIDHVRNSYIRSDGPLTAVIGVEEVVVVAMNDAVLVGHRDNLPRLKDVVQRMSDGKHRAATEHAVMHRPWGSYQDIDRGERFRAKRLSVKPGGKLSLQSHKRRAEHWVVVKGVAEVVLDGKIMTLHENQSVYIPMGGIHRLSNPGSEPLEVVEVQTGHYLEEDDITRYEDIYARV